MLSEIPDRWARSLRQWRRLNPSLRSTIDGQEVPSADEEIRIYQTLVGAWPFEPEQEPEFRERVSQFLRKACREAKLHSDWLEPNEPYEEALLRFAAGLIDADPDARFKSSFRSLWRAVAFHGAWNSLSQLLIKITAPGVPDIYQGTELWTFHLVDPDNRGAVDYAKCREMLAKIREGRARKSRRLLKELARTWQDGRIKLFVTDTLLDFRRENSDLFAGGSYTPLHAEGARNQCIFAFARQAGSSWAVTLAPRTTAALAAARGPLGAGAQWADTAVVLPATLPPGGRICSLARIWWHGSSPQGRRSISPKASMDFPSRCCSPRRKFAGVSDHSRTYSVRYVSEFPCAVSTVTSISFLCTAGKTTLTVYCARMRSRSLSMADGISAIEREMVALPPVAPAKVINPV